MGHCYAADAAPPDHAMSSSVVAAFHHGCAHVYCFFICCLPLDCAFVWLLAGLALAVANSTMLVGPHGSDDEPLPDAAYGITAFRLVEPAPEPPCHDRNCQNYDPSQSWYWSSRTGTIMLANAEANAYRCYEGPCYQLTSHLPSTATLCLAQVQPTVIIALLVLLWQARCVLACAVSACLHTGLVETITIMD